MREKTFQIRTFSWSLLTLLMLTNIHAMIIAFNNIMTAMTRVKASQKYHGKSKISWQVNNICNSPCETTDVTSREIRMRRIVFIEHKNLERFLRIFSKKWEDETEIFFKNWRIFATNKMFWWILKCIQFWIVQKRYKATWKVKMITFGQGMFQSNNKVLHMRKTFDRKLLKIIRVWKKLFHSIFNGM